jgi:hypothetical protein
MSQNVLDLIQVNGGGLYLQLFGKYWEITGSAEGQVFTSNPEIATTPALPANAQLGPTLGSDSFIFAASNNTAYLMCDGNYTAYPISGPAIGYYQLIPNYIGANPLLSEWILATSTVSQQVLTAPSQ